jgi:hypothetical protein
MGLDIPLLRLRIGPSWGSNLLLVRSLADLTVGVPGRARLYRTALATFPPIKSRSRLLPSRPTAALAVGTTPQSRTKLSRLAPWREVVAGRYSFLFGVDPRDNQFGSVGKTNVEQFRSLGKRILRPRRKPCPKLIAPCRDNRRAREASLFIQTDAVL